MYHNYRRTINKGTGHTFLIDIRVYNNIQVSIWKKEFFFSIKKIFLIERNKISREIRILQKDQKEDFLEQIFTRLRASDFTQLDGSLFIHKCNNLEHDSRVD